MRAPNRFRLLMAQVATTVRSGAVATSAVALRLPKQVFRRGTASIVRSNMECRVVGAGFQICDSRGRHSQGALSVPAPTLLSELFCRPVVT